MRYSKLFTRTRKQPPKDEVSKNAQLLVQAGMVSKLMAGVYSYLPLGRRVLEKIESIIREEMDKIDGQEVRLPALHPAENWQQTSGWENIEVLFKITSRTGRDYALGQSHEEVVTPLVKEYVQSYKDLPVMVYQIQNKYRDELRAKSGLLRGREFGMKDMYSFHLDQKDFNRYYERVKKSYLKIFSRCGLTAKATEASGGSFSEKISYEFMVLTEAGEDEILHCPDCDYCVNLEIAEAKEGQLCPSCGQEKLKRAEAAEVGNVFDLGRKYTEDFDFWVLDQQGKKVNPIMGCYGIGTSRLMAVIVEKFNDQKGICWPRPVAPFSAHLIDIYGDDNKKGEQIYQKLTKKGIDLFWDDRPGVSAGEKLADADLIGIPVRLIISQETGGKIEWKSRTKSKSELLSLNQVVSRLKRLV